MSHDTRGCSDTGWVLPEDHARQVLCQMYARQVCLSDVSSPPRSSRTPVSHRPCPSRTNTESDADTSNTAAPCIHGGSILRRCDCFSDDTVLTTRPRKKMNTHSMTKNILNRIDRIKAMMLENLDNYDRTLPVARMNMKKHPNAATSIVIARNRVRRFATKSKELENELNRLRLQLRRKQNSAVKK